MKTCKLKIIKRLICLLLAFSSLPIVAQTFTVKGVVSDATGALPGITIVEKGTTNGVSSDLDGSYTINLANPSATLVFSSVGYMSQIIAVKNRPIINILMETDVTSLESVVVIGYGTARKRDLTGAMTTMDSKAISGQTVQNAAQALQGKIAGVQITNSGDPGGSPSFKIRGLATAKSGALPLFVVDGVMVDNISYLGPNDIENITVLKDASSSAIYGVRAANGVVIVTTKQGKREGKPTISFGSYLGYKKASNLVDMADGPTYIKLYNEKMEALNENKRLDPSKFTSHNYFDDILRSVWIHDKDLSIIGGGTNTKYSFGIRHLSDDGLINKNDFSRLSFRSKLDVDITNNIRTGFSTVISSAKSNPVNSDVLVQAYRALPIYAPRDKDGNWIDPNQDNISGTMPNPTGTNYYDNQWKTKIDAVLNAYLEVDILKDFTAKTSVALNPTMENWMQFTPIHEVSKFQSSEKNILSKKRFQSLNFFWDNTLTYSKKINSHNLKAMIGTSYETYENNFLEASISGLKDLPSINHSFLFLSMPRIDDYGSSVSDGGSRIVSISYMGRLNYDYQGKYLLTATARRDGSSKFPEYNRWGFFPSIGLGWVASDEEFIKKYDILDFLKVRASWGILGNDNIPANLYNALIDTSDYMSVAFGSSQNTGNGTVMRPGTITSMHNPNLKWEEVHETNLGVDLKLLDSRLSSSIDWYTKTTKDAVFPIVSLGSSGLNTSGTWGNNASINNTGIEFSLGWNETKGDFSYTLSGNFTYNKNKITQINVDGGKGLWGKFDDTSNITFSTIGKPIATFYGYKVIGVFQNQEQIDSTPHLPGARPGDLIFADVDGNEEIDEADRTDIGSPHAPFLFGFDASFGYKNFDFSLALQGVAGNKIFNASRMLRYGTENFDMDFVNNRWHGEGTSNSYPSALWSNPTTPNSFYVEDGSYLRIRSIQLGYTFPPSLLKKINVQQLRLYLNAENLATFTKYNGFSPDIPSSNPLLSGIDRNTYPLSTIYSFGLNITF